MPLTAGARLGPYDIVSLIGAGGMGEVYRARDTRLARDVALKVLPESFSADADRLRRFEQEACAAGALNHPNVLVVHDFGSHGGAPFLVSELLEGTTLREHLSGPMPVRRLTADDLQHSERRAVELWHLEQRGRDCFQRHRRDRAIPRVRKRRRAGASGDFKPAQNRGLASVSPGRPPLYLPDSS